MSVPFQFCVVCICVEFCRVFCCLIPKCTSIWKRKVSVSRVSMITFRLWTWIESHLSCVVSRQDESRLLSYASCTAISQSSIFMIQMFRFYKMYVLLSLLIELSYFSYLIIYTNSMIIVHNEWHIFIHPGCIPCCGCVPCTIFCIF